MESRSRRYRALVERAGYACEQCGRAETDERRLVMWHIDGDVENMEYRNTVVLCPGCRSHIARLWPPGSNWEWGAPAWAVNRGHFHIMTDAEREEIRRKNEVWEKVQRRADEARQDAGREAGRKAAEILRTGKRGRGEKRRRKK
jgi:hypothetical protein